MMQPGANLEFARTEGIEPAEAMERAAEAGYRFVEPYVYTDVTIPINSHLSVRGETPYWHFRSTSADANAASAQLEKTGLKFSAIDAHCSLLLPQFAVPYLKGAIDFAAATGAPIVMSDEGPLPDRWMSLESGFDVMCLALNEITRYARERGVLYAMELHNALTARPEYLLRLLDRFGPEDLGVNFDTGNSFLAGNDPVEYLRRVADRVVHVHIKDIPESQLGERGKVTGTRVGVAAGDGVIDLPGIARALAEVGYAGVLSVECDTLDEAARSRAYMESIIEEARNGCKESR